MLQAALLTARETEVGRGTAGNAHENGPLVWFCKHPWSACMCQALCLGLGRIKNSGLGLGPSYQEEEADITQTCGVHLLGLGHAHSVVPDWCPRILCFHGVATSGKPS